MKLKPKAFIEARHQGVILDVRSPKEFEQGHMTSALNLPLFSNEERAIVGTCYKEEGREAAVKVGLKIIGPRMATLVEQAEELCGENTIYIYCWRGGMRSGSMAWLLQTAGKKVVLLEGGYKAYRSYLSEEICAKGELIVLGGYTGSGKTKVLHEIVEQGGQILDLEKLANHPGSSFGNLLNAPQPENEQFINSIGEAFLKLDMNKPIWVEDESRMIGNVWLPEDFYARLSHTPLLAIDKSIDERARFLSKDYGMLPKDQLKLGFDNISRRLGGLRVQEAHDAIDGGDLVTAAKIALQYYDKAYEHGIGKRKGPIASRIEMSGKTHKEIANYLLKNQEKWTSSKISN